MYDIIAYWITAFFVGFYLATKIEKVILCATGTCIGGLIIYFFMLATNKHQIPTIITNELFTPSQVIGIIGLCVLVSGHVIGTAYEKYWRFK